MSPITDGTVVWRMRDSRCRYTVGELVTKMGPLNDYDHLLLCDGSTISATDYPDLVAALGGTQLPNLIGRVLQGDSVGGSYKAAGLPNIFGNIGLVTGGAVNITGAFYTDVNLGSISHISTTLNGYDSVTAFSASRTNAIYGASTTVQPPAYTTRIYICYAG